uniref:PWI domain-containing protein n=1 Tax=Davidia involucrata TaxID=16924 RepID=A0A5B7ASH8_DAVIN
MGIISDNPKSFKIDRKSSLASKLKSSISKKLVEFLGNYTDDVLAEYITVLVCNGKHQNQARDDLEAFLGERSGEFVSWLWDLLLKYGHHSNSAIVLSDPKDITFTSACNGDVGRDLRSNRLKNLQNHNSGNADNSLTTTGKFYHPSIYACNPVPSGDMEFSEGFQCCKGSVAPLNGVNTNKVQSQTQRSAILREVAAAENIHDNSLMHGTFRKEGSSVIPTGREQSIQCMDKSKKIVDSNCIGLHNQLLNLPKREMISRNSQSSITEGPCTRQISATNVPARSPPRAVSAVSCQNKKSRGSVWDRLGKPCEKSVSDQTIDAHSVNIVEQDQKVLDQHTMLCPVFNEELTGRMKNEVNELDKRCTANSPGEYSKMEHDVTICKIHVANNIRQKRHFGEISTGPNSGSVSLLGESNMDPQCKESSQDIKRSTLASQTSEATKPALVSQVQDVKKRLRQIESEMSKLRSKQLKMKKDGQPNVLPNSGAMRHSEEDVESRTVFVTNVNSVKHFIHVFLV